MKAETRILLVKELEKLKSIRARNSFIGAIGGLIFSIVWLSGIYTASVIGNSKNNSFWFTFIFIIALVILLQSFYIIIRHITNRKLSILFEAVLEIKDGAEVSINRGNEIVDR